MSNPLLDQYKSGNLAHAMLLIGSAAKAEQLVTELISELRLSAADYLLFTGEETIKITDIRQIIKFASLTRSQSEIKLIFISRAQLLSTEAANALLKTLEEPPAGTHLVLASDQPESLLPTIISRCQTIRLSGEAVLGAIDATALPTKQSLPEWFNLAKSLAAEDTPLPGLFADWLAQTHRIIAEKRAVTRETRLLPILLRYNRLAQTNANRRLLLDNFFLEIYNLDE